MPFKGNMSKLIINIVYKLKEIKWFVAALLLLVLIAFPVIKAYYERLYGINGETLNIITNMIYVFYSFFCAAMVTVSSRAVFEEKGNELLYLYQRLSLCSLLSFALTVLLYLSSFLILIPNYGFLFEEYVKLMLFCAFLSGISVFLLTVTKTAAPSLLLLTVLLAYEYFNSSFVFKITGAIGAVPACSVYVMGAVGVMAIAASVLLYRRTPSFK